MPGRDSGGSGKATHIGHRRGRAADQIHPTLFPWALFWNAAWQVKFPGKESHCPVS